jgi:microcystin-dependent protein
MIEAFYGMIAQFAFRWEPEGWMYCHGQVISIQSNTPLFSLLGTTFGGDGQVTFALPDLRVKKADGSYYQYGEKMSNGVPYIDSYICVSGIYPSRQD